MWESHDWTEQASHKRLKDNQMKHGDFEPQRNWGLIQLYQYKDVQSLGPTGTTPMRGKAVEVPQQLYKKLEPDVIVTLESLFASWNGSWTDR